MELEDSIKALQMSDPAAGDAWEIYCAQSYEGIYDPNSHTTKSLETFVTTYISAPPLPWTGSRMEAGGAQVVLRERKPRLAHVDAGRRLRRDL